MIKVDLQRKIVYEVIGVDEDKLKRLKTVTSLDGYVGEGWRYYHLSEWVVVKDDFIVCDKSFRSVADANYFIKQKGFKECQIRRMNECLSRI